MLSTQEFAEWSKQVVLGLHVTSRVDGEQYPSLLLQTGGIGFPTVSFLDADLRLLQQVGNVVTLDQCERALAELRRWQALRAEVEAGGAGAAKEKELFLLELRMGNRPFAEMTKRKETLTLTPGELTAATQALIDLEFQEILRATPRDQQAAAGARFLQMFRQGRIPAASNATAFWQYQFAHATEAKDVPLFEELLGWLREHKQDDPRLVRYMKLLEQQLEQLRAAK